MKILHIDTGRELRGGQHQLLLLLQGLAGLGHEQILLAREPVRQRFPGVEPTLGNLRKQARHVDLIHAHDGRGHTLAVAALAGKPLVVARRVAFPVQTGLLSRWKYRAADHYIAISNHVRHQLQEAGIGDAMISVVPDGVILDQLPPGPRQRGTHVVAPRINDPLKGAALLEAACRQAGVEVKLSANLIEDLPNASAFVYLSENEGLGSAILLAMARKVPVIASRVGGIPELIEHEVHGLLVDNETGQIAAALTRMQSDPLFAEQCAERAYQRACEQFRDDIMVAQTEQIYRAILERRPRP